MRTLERFFITAIFMIILYNGFSQGDKTYAERLGYPAGSKLLILHVDDAGMSDDSNIGVELAIEKGVANSCSMMMPCSWIPGFVHYLKMHPNIDAGIHMTLTSEWPEYRWGPLMGKNQVPGLVDNEGDLWPDVTDVSKHATADEVEKEMQAQIDRALSMGWKPTHIDSHMGAVLSTPSFIQRYIKVAISNKIPAMFPAGHCSLIKKEMDIADPQLNMMRGVGNQLWNAGLPVLDDLHNESYGWEIPKEAMGDSSKLDEYRSHKYVEAIESLKPGITMMIMHCTQTSGTFAHISNSGALRKGDLLAMLNPQVKEAIGKNGITLVTWRELMDKRSKIK